MKIKLLKYIAIASFLFAEAVWAGDVEDADSALGRKDYVTALKKYKIAAARNDAYAQLQAGNIYREGLGVKKDDVEAARWYKLAITQGNTSAQTHLAAMIRLGRGVVKDDAEAARLFGLAAERGDIEAQFILAGMYVAGEGVTQDYFKAAQLYKPVAEQGNSDAQMIIALMYFLGAGMRQDHVRAHMWSNLASVSSLGNRKKRDEIASAMTPQQIAEAQKLARECQARNFKNCD